MSANDGGPAFPGHKDIPLPGSGSYRDDTPGMSLRDYFAGQALAGMFAVGVPGSAETPEDWHRLYAKEAYGYADAMLKERDR